MRTTRQALAAAMAMTLLGGLSGSVVAQDGPHAPLPGEGKRLSFVTEHGKMAVSPTVDHRAGRTTYRDHLNIGPIDANDQRLSGDGWVIYHYDIFDDSGPSPDPPREVGRCRHVRGDYLLRPGGAGEVE